MIHLILCVLSLTPADEEWPQDWDSYVSGGEVATGDYLVRLKHANAFHKKRGWRSRNDFLEEEIDKNFAFQRGFRVQADNGLITVREIQKMVPERNKRVCDELVEKFGANEIRKVKLQSVRDRFEIALLYDRGFHELVGLSAKEAETLVKIFRSESQLQTDLGIYDRGSKLELLLQNLPKKVKSRLELLGLKQINVIHSHLLLSSVTAGICQRYRFAR